MEEKYLNACVRVRVQSCRRWEQRKKWESRRKKLFKYSGCYCCRRRRVEWNVNTDTFIYACLRAGRQQTHSLKSSLHVEKRSRYQYIFIRFSKLLTRCSNHTHSALARCNAWAPFGKKYGKFTQPFMLARMRRQRRVPMYTILQAWFFASFEIYAWNQFFWRQVFSINLINI